jgi:hypothetical protein
MSKKNKRKYPEEVEQAALDVNKQVATINHDLKDAKLKLAKYTEEQVALRNIVRSDNHGLGYFQFERLKKNIMYNRIILRGFHAYIKDLKKRREKLNKSHPKNMKKSTK